MLFLPPQHLSLVGLHCSFGSRSFRERRFTALDISFLPQRLTKRIQRAGIFRVQPDGFAESGHGVVQVPYANVRIRTDVPPPQRTYIEERQNLFPGVTVESVYLRQYPNQTLAAQILGTIGQINGNQIKATAFQGIAASGSGGIGAVSAGIAEALVETALGLVVAIPAVWFYNYLTGRIEYFNVEMDNSSSELVDYFIKKTA